MARWQLITLLLLAGCSTIETVRPDRELKSFYDRLTPYYDNTLEFKPRTRLLAYSWLAGADVPQPDGTSLHVDYLKFDVELFFARAVPLEGTRKALAIDAIRLTCPEAKVVDLQRAVTISTETYMLIENQRCLGHAR